MSGCEGVKKGEAACQIYSEHNRFSGLRDGKSGLSDSFQSRRETAAPSTSCISSAVKFLSLQLLWGPLGVIWSLPMVRYWWAGVSERRMLWGKAGEALSLVESSSCFVNLLNISLLRAERARFRKQRLPGGSTALLAMQPQVCRGQDTLSKTTIPKCHLVAPQLVSCWEVRFLSRRWGVGPKVAPR